MRPLAPPLLNSGTPITQSFQRINRENQLCCLLAHHFRFACPYAVIVPNFGTAQCFFFRALFVLIFCP